MENLIEPNIHPILVHFAYALSLSALGVYLLGKLLPTGARQDSIQPAGDWMLAIGALAIVATIAAGFQAYYSVVHDGPSHAAMTTHRNWAVPSGTAILILAIWRFLKRAKPPSRVFLGLLAAAALSLSVTAWWGGNLVYKYGLGVQSLPSVTDDGHDHDHGETSGRESPETKLLELMSLGHENVDDHHSIDSAPTDTLPAILGSPAAVADRFSLALRTKNAAALRSLFFADAIIAEGGAVERSFAVYADHHMKSDMAYTASITTQMIKRDVVQSDNMATVITQSEMVGNYKGDSVHNAMMETMTLRREAKAWEIAHIHWSSVPLKGGVIPMPKPEMPISDHAGHDNLDGNHNHDPN